MNNHEYKNRMSIPENSCKADVSGIETVFYS
jgi:hypothetical protein